MKSPELSSGLSDLPPAPPVKMAEYEQSRHERQQETRHKVEKAIAVLVVGLSVGMSTASAFMRVDIQNGRAYAASIEPELEHVYDPTSTADENRATIVLTGFNTKESSSAAEVLKAHADFGHVFALDYGGSYIDVDTYTKVVMDGLKAEEKKTGVPIRYLNLDGYSMGGVALSAIGAEIQVTQPNVYIVGDTMNSTPIGKDGVATQVMDIASSFVGRALNACFNEVKVCDGMQYSRFTQAAAEVYSADNQFINHDGKLFDLRGFINVVRSTNAKVSNPSLATPALAYNQAAIVEGAPINFPDSDREQFMTKYSIDKIVQILSKPKDGIKPIIHYTMAEQPSRDHIVNVAESSKVLEQMAKKYDADVEFTPLDVTHFNVFQRQDLYNKFIKTTINPSVNQVIADSQNKNQNKDNSDNQLYSAVTAGGSKYSSLINVKAGLS